MSFTRRPEEDPTGIREWLQWKRGDARTVPDPIIVPQPADVPVEPPETILPAEPVEAEPEPLPGPVKKVVDEPKKAESCYHCNGPMPTFRSAGARYCSPACKGAARRRLDRLQPYYPT
jgi:hypothetical protein